MPRQLPRRAVIGASVAAVTAAVLTPTTAAATEPDHDATAAVPECAADLFRSA